MLHIFYEFDIVLMDPQRSFFNLTEFVNRGKTVLELVQRCFRKMPDMPVNPHVEPGFLRKQLEQSAPEQGTSLQEVCKDTETKYFPGIVHWQSPKFFAYFPSCISEVSIYAQILATAFNCPGFSYAVSPSHTELENIVVDWSSLALNLPKKFLIRNEGGGVILGSATESLFLAVHAAKLTKMAELNITLANPQITKLVGYVSETAHVASQRGLMLKDIPHRRQVPCVFDQTVGNYVVDLAKLREMLENDKKQGLIPFFYGASVGTTFSAAVDQIEEIGKLCKEFGMWLNVDAAYLGPTWICPEMRQSQKGIDYADSLVLNYSKPLFMGSGGSMFYIADKKKFLSTMGTNVQFSFYKNKYSEEFDVIDYKDWQVGLNHRNNAIRLYFLFKIYGLRRLRQSLTDRQNLAIHLEKKIQESKYFQMFSKRAFSLVCFRFKLGDKNQLTKELSPLVKDLQQGYCTPAVFKGTYIIRIVIANANTTIEHIDAYWNKILSITQKFAHEKGL